MCNKNWYSTVKSLMLAKIPCQNTSVQNQKVEPWSWYVSIDKPLMIKPFWPIVLSMVCVKAWAIAPCSQQRSHKLVFTTGGKNRLQKECRNSIDTEWHRRAAAIRYFNWGYSGSMTLYKLKVQSWFCSHAQDLHELEGRQSEVIWTVWISTLTLSQFPSVTQQITWFLYVLLLSMWKQNNENSYFPLL